MEEKDILACRPPALPSSEDRLFLSPEDWWNCRASRTGKHSSTSCARPRERWRRGGRLSDARAEQRHAADGAAAPPLNRGVSGSL